MHLRRIQNTERTVKKPTILIADDSEDILHLLRIRLSKLGFCVITAKNGLDAIESFASKCPDLVLMDMNMPGMDGWQATSYIRSGGSWTPIIATTAYGLPGDQARALAAGCNLVHVKPFKFEELVEQIEELLANKPCP